MEIKELENSYQNICNLISQQKIKLALDKIYDLIKYTANSDLIANYEQILQTYKYIIEYAAKGTQDPSREDVLTHMLHSVYELADKCRHQAFILCKDLPKYDLQKHYKLASKLNLLNIEEIIEKIDKDIDIQEHIIEKAELRNLSKEDKKQRIIELIFYRIWLLNNLQDTDIELIKYICNTDIYNWHEKALLISSLIISLLRFFDVNKLLLLIDFYNKGENHIRQRAEAGLLIGMYKYDKRLKLYPEIINKTKLLHEDKDFQKNLGLIIIQILRSQDTEKITKKVRDEIIPEVVKAAPTLNKKLDLENMLKDNMFEDKNPEWENVFAETPDLFQKMEELSKMQMEGADILMGTFSMLKHFDFFKEMQNWFLPFYADNKEVKTILEKDAPEFNNDKFLKAMKLTPYMCNSDKYSFVLNLKNMPGPQKLMLSKVFVQEILAHNELDNEDELLKKGTKDWHIITQFIQDLYRFYKLYDLKILFPDFFSIKFDFSNSDTINSLSNKPLELIKNIGEFYFEKSHYQEALEIYLDFNKKGINSYQVLQKIAYCYQQLKDHSQALNYYLKAELYDQNKVWNLKKIGYCYQKLNQPEKALHYFLEAEKIEPENLSIQTNIGKSLLDMKDFEQALKYLFKVEYLSPSNIKVMRPISWCYFVKGNFDSAEKYLKRIIDIEGNEHDFLNLGHVYLCKKEYKLAHENYLKSVELFKNNYHEFYNEFVDDKLILTGHGVNENDIPLILDFLAFQI